MHTDGPRFALDTRAVLQLLAGERFYSSADASLREAVLNAVDACGRAVALDQAPSPIIQVHFDASTLRIAVEDNGDGMSLDDIRALFTTVGASASRLISLPEGRRFEAVGEFGIGVVSYFLACSEFTIHSRKLGHDPVALQFSDQMLDGETPSTHISNSEQHCPPRGTRLTFRCRTPDIYDLLVKRFPHWIRQVEGLNAIDVARAKEMPQGAFEDNVDSVEVPLPGWAERVAIGPPRNIGAWGTLDGHARVQILYRGVFIMDYGLPGPWGVRGTVWVNPKRFKPRLNRESLLSEGLEPAMKELLTAAHPPTLVAAARIVSAWPKHGDELSWNEDRWRTLWTSVPSGDAYAAAQRVWDAVLRSRRLIPIMDAQGERHVSFDELLDASGGVVYVAPQEIPRDNVLLRQAVASLRAKGRTIVRSFQRSRGFMDDAYVGYRGIVDILLARFASSSFTLIGVESIAGDEARQSAALVGLFGEEGVLKLAHLGPSGDAVALVGTQVWINVDSDGGRQVLIAMADSSEPVSSALLAIMKEPRVLGDRYAIARRIFKSAEFPPLITPVRRRAIRRIVG